MWLILPPSTSSPSAPASADSTSELTLPQAERLASSAGLSGTLRPAKSWRRAWRIRQSLRSLSGATCEPSMADAGVDAWISSLRDIRASRSAPPGGVVERTILGIYGRTSLAWLARLNPASCFSRTSPDTSLSASMLYAPICEPSATELRRDCLARRKLARLRGASTFSSLLPRPQASDNRNRGTIVVTPRMVSRVYRGKQVMLSILWRGAPCPWCVESMVGLPEGHTNPASPIAETAWNHWSQRMRSSLSRLVYLSENIE